MTEALIGALSRREPTRESVFIGTVVSASSGRVSVSGIAREPLSCRWSDEFRLVLDEGTAVGRSVVVVLAAGQPVIICAIDEGA
jgi:hypothetical protein